MSIINRCLYDPVLVIFSLGYVALHTANQISLVFGVRNISIPRAIERFDRLNHCHNMDGIPHSLSVRKYLSKIVCSLPLSGRFTELLFHVSFISIGYHEFR